MTHADPLAEVKARVAAEHLGDPQLGSRLRGGNVAQLRADAEQLRADAGAPDDGERFSFAAADYLRRKRAAVWAERLFGR